MPFIHLLPRNPSVHRDHTPQAYQQHAAALRCEPSHERSVNSASRPVPLTRLPRRLCFAPLSVVAFAALDTVECVKNCDGAHADWKKGTKGRR
jgi:hypothetical protein